jgi:16S rRNA (uracil1498-N3)-methyltransferase
MPADRFFIDTPLEPFSRLSLEGEEFHHLHRVMRMQEGEALEVVNGKNQLAKARIERIDKMAAQLSIQEVVFQPVKEPKIILAQALPKLSHLEWILEKGTELGAHAFWLFPGQLSEKEGLNAKQEERLKKITIAAMKQCGRLDLPPLSFHPPIKQWNPLPYKILLADPDPTVPYLWQLPSSFFREKDPLLICIGPERGFSSQEKEVLKASLGALCVRIHPNTLRAETAPLAALSILHSLIIT